MENTAIDFLINEMRELDIQVSPNSSLKLLDILNKAKELEKNQIIKAWDDAYNKGLRTRSEKISNPAGDADQYYNKTFKPI